jgi:hypothetical protein
MDTTQMNRMGLTTARISQEALQRNAQSAIFSAFEVAVRRYYRFGETTPERESYTPTTRRPSRVSTPDDDFWFLDGSEG